MFGFNGKACGAVAHLLLVAALPAGAIANPDVHGQPTPAESWTAAQESLPELKGCSAAELVSSQSHVSLPWSPESSDFAVIRPVRHDAPEPHVTSVPVAAIVGGCLIATLGITQRIRRARGLNA